jgi:hypothetical protein
VRRNLNIPFCKDLDSFVKAVSNTTEGEKINKFRKATIIKANEKYKINEIKGNEIPLLMDKNSIKKYVDTKIIENEKKLFNPPDDISRDIIKATIIRPISLMLSAISIVLNISFLISISIGRLLKFGMLKIAMVRILIILVIFLAIDKIPSPFSNGIYRNVHEEMRSYDHGLLAKIWGDGLSLEPYVYTFGSEILGGHLIDKKSLQK